MFEVLRATLEAVAAQKPLVMVAEDLHWADPYSRDLLSFLLRRLRGAVLVVATYYQRGTSDDEGQVVYVVVYTPRVRRTNIYLSAAEQDALDAKAAAEGSTRSQVLRALVDHELNLDDTGSKEVDAALVELASELAAASRQLSADDADLSSAG